MGSNFKDEEEDDDEKEHSHKHRDIDSDKEQKKKRENKKRRSGIIRGKGSRHFKWIYSLCVCVQFFGRVLLRQFEY